MWSCAKLSLKNRGTMLPWIRIQIYTLRGPRQVGKTTMLKLMIKRLLDNPQISKEQVLYYSSDNIDSYKEIIELLETYFAFINGLPNPPERAFIFLDEITGIKQWQKGLNILLIQAPWKTR